MSEVSPPCEFPGPHPAGTHSITVGFYYEHRGRRYGVAGSPWDWDSGIRLVNRPCAGRKP